MAFVVGSCGSSFGGDGKVVRKGGATSALVSRNGAGASVSMSMAQNRRRFEFNTASAANMRSFSAAVAQKKNMVAGVTTSTYSTGVAEPAAGAAVNMSAAVSAAAAIYAAQQLNQAAQKKMVAQPAQVQAQPVMAPAFSPLASYARPVPVEGGMSAAAMAWAAKQTGRVVVPARAPEAAAPAPAAPKAAEPARELVMAAETAPTPAAVQAAPKPAEPERELVMAAETKPAPAPTSARAPAPAGVSAAVTTKVAAVAMASVAAAEQPASLATSRAHSTRSPLEAIVLGFFRGLTGLLGNKDERKIQKQTAAAGRVSALVLFALALKQMAVGL